MSLQFVPNYVDIGIAPATWARAREAEGWHGVAVADHLWHRERAYPHVWVSLGAMAAATTRVMLTSSFANNLIRSPVEFAQAAMTVQQASDGRFEAGLGAGWVRAEIEQIGHRYPPPPERISRYIEAITIAGELLRTRHCTYHGEYYGVDVDILGPDVAPPPLVASVGGPRSIREGRATRRSCRVEGVEPGDAWWRIGLRRVPDDRREPSRLTGGTSAGGAHRRPAGNVPAGRRR